MVKKGIFSRVLLGQTNPYPKANLGELFQGVQTSKKALKSPTQSLF